jgi:hypothetical protein
MNVVAPMSLKCGYTRYGHFLKGFFVEDPSSEIRQTLPAIAPTLVTYASSPELRAATGMHKATTVKVNGLADVHSKMDPDGYAARGAFFQKSRPNNWNEKEGSPSNRLAKGEKMLARRSVASSLPDLRGARSSCSPTAAAQLLKGVVYNFEKKTKSSEKSVREHVGSAEKIQRELRKLEVRRREASESLRILVFGYIGNEAKRHEEKNVIFEQKRGSLRELNALAAIWIELDSTCSGIIEQDDFLYYFDTREDQLLCAKVMLYIDDFHRSKSKTTQTKEQHEKRKSRVGHKCTRKDLLQVMWCGAGKKDLEVMQDEMIIYHLEAVKTPTPPLLSAAQVDELIANYKYLDQNNSCSIPYAYLEEAGLCSREIVNQLKKKYDVNQDNEIDPVEFITMLCPVGFRPHPASDTYEDGDSNTWKCVVGTFAGKEFRGYLNQTWLDVLPEMVRSRLTPAPPEEHEVMSLPRRLRLELGYED